MYLATYINPNKNLLHFENLHTQKSKNFPALYIYNGT